MDIHVVQSGETIEEIAELYGVTAQQVIIDNELTMPDKLVPGQTIVIVYPEKTYIVQEGDTLLSIAASNGISLKQLLRNNAFLSDRTNIIPGESLVISYNNNKGKVITSGFAYPYINIKTLRKTLPYLTYLSIFNYTVTRKGELIPYYDDTEIIKISKEYGVAPLLLITTLTVKGEPDINAVYDILSNEALQEHYISIILDLIRNKGYYGVNISFQYLNTSNQNIYLKLFNKISKRAKSENIPLFVTINPNKTFIGNELVYEKVDYSGFNPSTNFISFINFNWGYNFGPPIPIGSISDLDSLIKYAVNYINPNKISVGIPILAYDWELPYVVGFSSAHALTLDSAINLTREVGSVIEFDELSQNPYVRYTENVLGIQHLIWFIDARSINSMMNLVMKYQLRGTGVWNIMNYYPQMWLVINSQYEIETLEL